MTEFLRIVERHRPAAYGGLVLLVASLIAALAPVLPLADPVTHVGMPYEAPSSSAIFGTDALGRDIFSRVIWGARTSLFVGLSSTLVGLSTGAAWGTASAFFGSWFDTISQRIVDALVAFPGLLVVLVITVVLGQSVANVILAIAILFVGVSSRTYRALVLSLRNAAYVEAARSIGATNSRVIFFHVVPNTFNLFLVLVSVQVSTAVLLEASLSFLGVGIPADTPSWGGDLSRGMDALFTGAPWLVAANGIALGATILALNLFGDGVRDALDPRLRNV